MALIDNPIFIGFVRICFIFLFSYYLHILINVVQKLNFLNFLITFWFRLGIIFVLVLFISINLNIYSLFNSVVIFILLYIFEMHIFKNKKNFFKRNFKLFLQVFLKSTENKKKIWAPLLISNSSNKINIFTIIFLVSINYISSSNTTNHSNYILSDKWISDINKIINVDLQGWINDDLSANGTFAIANFYSKILKINPGISFNISSFLVLSILAIIIYWMVKKLTPSKFFAPVISSLSFSFIFISMPTSINFFFQNNSTFLALTFALPLIVFLFIKLEASLICTGSFFYFSLAFVAIGLIDFFSLFILLPPGFFIASIFGYKMNRDKLHKFIYAYIFALFILFLFYLIINLKNKIPAIEFLHSNLVLINSYNVDSNFVILYNKALLYLRYSTYIGLLLMIFLTIFKKENWSGSISLFIYFNIIFFLIRIKNDWIEVEILNNCFLVFFPIVLGLNIAVLISLAKIVIKQRIHYSVYTKLITVIIIIFFSIFFLKQKMHNKDNVNLNVTSIFNAYNKISGDFFPFSTTIVNDSRNRALAIDKQYFMNFSYFLKSYSRIDSTFYSSKNNKGAIKTHAQNAIANSILVFVSSEEALQKKSTKIKLTISLHKELQKLKRKGRMINLFYEDNHLKIYEIINEPNKSKIADLIF